MTPSFIWKYTDDEGQLCTITWEKKKAARLPSVIVE